MGFLKFALMLIGVVIALGGFAMALRHATTTTPGDRYTEDKTEFDLTKVNVVPAILGVILCIGCFVFQGSFGIVPSGSVGVVLRNSATTGKVLLPGLYSVTPFFEKVELLNTQTEAYPVNNASAASHDLQEVSTNIVLNFHPDATHAVDIWNDLRNDYTDRIVAPAVQEAMKAATANYTAEQLITERYKAQEDFRKDLTSRMNQFHLIIDAISMTDFRFSDQFNQAIEAKVTQEQSALQAKAKLEQVKYEAEQTRTKADAEAYANRVKQQSLTPELVQYEAIQQWDGHLPQYTGGQIPFINVAPAKT
jgi:regulator of protease activity HflC (stomatin/prohibitin superfamily)